MQRLHLSLLLLQHLLEDWKNPLFKYDVIVVGHQKVSDPASSDVQQVHIFGKLSPVRFISQIKVSIL